jgi:DNA replication and repair protein RecF
MRIDRLQLQHYRSITAGEFEIHPQLTVFLGANGSGKTNTLEAVSLLSVPRSFRGSKDKDLIAWNQLFSRIEGSIVYADDRHKQLVVFLQEDKKLQVDGQPQTVSQFLGLFLSVLFAPEDVDVLGGPPSARRSLLDSHLSALSPIYLLHLLTYQQVLRQRNRLLARQQWPTDQELTFWNDQQLLHGVALIEMRLTAVDQINLVLPSSLRLAYVSTLYQEGPLFETFQRKQAGILDRERQMGYTLLGPQRDDWRLHLTEPEIDLGIFGSRGQQRMGVVALKQAQLQIIAAEKGETGVFLLDDVLSELDPDNQQLLIKSMGQQQTILTTASLSDIPDSLLENALLYEFLDGDWRKK